MPPPIPTFSQLSQPHHTLIKSNNNNTINIKPINPSLLTTHSSSLTNSSIKQSTNNLIDFKDKTTRFRLKNLVRSITSLSSSKNKTHILEQILEKDDTIFQIQTISDFNHLLMALVIAQEPELFQTIFTKLPSFHLVPDCCTYSIMIRCHCEKNDVDEAKRPLFTVLENGFEPDAAFNAITAKLQRRLFNRCIHLSDECRTPDTSNHHSRSRIRARLPQTSATHVPPSPQNSTSVTPHRFLS